MAEHDRTLAIIGDGHAAAALLIQLEKSGHDPAEITVIGDGGLGRGKAYGARSPHYRLNVRAELMKMFPDDDGFPSWAAEHANDPAAETTAGAFYRRSDFARYSTALLDQCRGAEAWHHRKARAIGLERDGTGWTIRTSDGKAINAHRVVLASGNPDAAPRFPISADAEGMITRQLWPGTWPEGLAPSAKVAIIGGGLTAMDCLLTLEQEGHHGNIELVTPGGMLPPVQADWEEAEAIETGPIDTASDLLALFRRHLPPTPWQSPQWQTAFEALRICLPSIWPTMPRRERIRALQRLSRFWQLARYRAAPQTTAAAAALAETGQLSCHADRVIAIDTDAEMARLQLRSGASLNADRVLIATGAGRDRLIDAGIANGLFPAGMRGLETDQNHRVFGANWSALPGLYAIGPQTAFARGDVVGATTISKEAASLTEQLMDPIKEPGP